MILSKNEIKWLEKNSDELFESFNLFTSEDVEFKGDETSSLGKKGILAGDQIAEAFFEMLRTVFSPEKLNKIRYSRAELGFDLYSCFRGNFRFLVIDRGPEIEIMEFSELNQVIEHMFPLLYDITPDYLQRGFSMDYYDFLCFASILDIVRKNILLAYIMEDKEEMNFLSIDLKTVIDKIQNPAAGSIVANVKTAFSVFLDPCFPAEGTWEDVTEEVLDRMEKQELILYVPERESYLPSGSIRELADCFALMHGIIRIESIVRDEKLQVSDTLAFQGRYGNLCIVCSEIIDFFTIRGADLVEVMVGSMYMERSEDDEAEGRGEAKAVFDEGNGVDTDRIRKPKFCGKCGHSLTDNIKFCPGCGNKLTV